MSTRGEEILARRNEAKKGELDEQLRVRSDFFKQLRVKSDFFLNN